MSDNKLLEVKNLKQYFNAGHNNEVKAIDDISFYVNEGETFGLVGESGCGKSTTGRSIIKLYNPTAGEIIFNGKNVSDIHNKKDLLDYRRQMQMIYQDPFASLNPKKRIRDIIGKGIKMHKLANSEKEVNERVAHYLELVGLDPDYSNRYPHEFSGGQCQRIGIARSLAVEPKFIICDEPISALDVSIQAQVINLLKDLQESQQLTYLFIAHDLSMVKYISDRIGVMYFGKLVEIASSEDIYKYSLHPYTESLLSAIPHPDPDFEIHRQRISYNPIDDGIKRSLKEIAPEHYVYCSDNEISIYQEKLNQKK